MDPTSRRATSGNAIASVVALGIAAAAAGISASYERRPTRSDPPTALVRRPTRPTGSDIVSDREVVNIFRPVPFSPGSAELRPEVREALDPVADMLARNVQITSLELMSDTDDRAGIAGARALTRRRADAVRDHLVSRGIEASRLEACPYGLERPLVPNDTAAHREQNNRIAYLVLSMREEVVLLPTPATPSDPPRGCPTPAPPVGAALVFGDQDRDGDGVPNLVDRCPSEPRAAREAPRQPRCAGCLRTDLDGDGVYDDEDRCRSELPGDHADRSRPGCPDGDVDGDRVFDSHDACPTDPPGPRPDPSRPGCPTPDRDGDTIADAVDRCPDAPMGLRPDAAREGCPAPDRDDDTVADIVDACPDAPGAPSIEAPRVGCPGLVRVSGERLAVSGPLTFARGAARWDAASTATVDAIADAVRASRWVYRVAVVARAETAALALRRAEMVADRMTARGVPPCDVEAFGEVTSADGPTEGALEFRLLEPRHPWNAGRSPRSTARYERRQKGGGVS